MTTSRARLLPAALSGALVLAAHGCASQGTNTGFSNSDDAGGGSGGSYDDGAGGGTSSGSSGAPASGSTSSGTGSGGGSSSATTSSTSSGSSSGSSSGTTSASSSGSSATEPCPTPNTPIDDMENGMGAIFSVCGRMGYWYTYADSTAGATLTPPVMMPFKDSMITPPRPRGDAGASTMAAMMSGM